MYLKEDANRSPEELEAAKQAHLKKQEHGQGQWDKELASKGEESVKADQETVHDHDSHMKDLQKETAKKGESGQL